VRVKVCGLSRPEHALVAAESGADFVGVVFAPSRRRITLDTAQGIARALELWYRMGIPRPSLVGVFADAPLEQVNAAAKAVPLDWVQLNGDEPVDYCLQVEAPVIKALRLPPSLSAEDAVARIGPYREALAPQGGLLLVESAVPGQYGGTGRAMDWALAGELARQVPFLLAGGLTPDNVGDAVERVRPWGVDVSSGIETGGAKDLSKIKAFVKHAREAER